MSDFRVTHASLALLLALSATSVAKAQDAGSPGGPPWRHGGQPQGQQTPTGQGQQHGGQGRHERGQGQPPTVIQNQTQQGQPAQGQGPQWNRHRGQQGQPQVQAPPVIQHQAPQGQPSWRGGSNQQRHRDGPGIQIYRGPDNYRSGSRPPLVQRRNDRLHDRGAFRHTWRAERRFHVRPYLRPRGWYLRDWMLGDILPSLFWSHNYWIVDYWLYGLPIPPDGCVWVRNDRDALLIDRYTGEVVEVIYDIFY